MEGRLSFVLAILVCFTIGSSEGVVCYNCSSAEKPNCLDPFNSAGINTCTGHHCSKLRVSVNGVIVVSRACETSSTDKNACEDITIAGYPGRACVCISDRCNDGKKLNSAPILFSVVAMTTIAMVNWMNHV